MVRVMTPTGPKQATEGAPFAEEIKRVAEEAGLTHFRVFVGDTEVLDPAQAPATVPADQPITIYAYDKAG